MFSALGKSDRSGWSLVLVADKRTLLVTEDTLVCGTALVPSAQPLSPAWDAGSEQPYLLHPDLADLGSWVRLYLTCMVVVFLSNSFS